MSTTDEVLSRIYRVRQKIIQSMLKVPFIIADAVKTVSTPYISDVLGVRRVNAPYIPVTTRVYAVDTNEPIRPAAVSPWYGAAVTFDSVADSAARVIEAVYRHSVIVAFDFEDGAKRVVKSIEMTSIDCVEWMESSESVVRAVVPPTYPLTRPATIRVGGWYGVASETYDYELGGQTYRVAVEVAVYIPEVAYRSDDRWVTWEGVAVHVSVVRENPDGTISLDVGIPKTRVVMPFMVREYEVATKELNALSTIGYIKITKPVFNGLCQD